MLNLLNLVIDSPDSLVVFCSEVTLFFLFLLAKWSTCRVIIYRLRLLPAVNSIRRAIRLGAVRLRLSGGSGTWVRTVAVKNLNLRIHQDNRHLLSDWNLSDRRNISCLNFNCWLFLQALLPGFFVLLNYIFDYLLQWSCDYRLSHLWFGNRNIQVIETNDLLSSRHKRAITISSSITITIDLSLSNIFCKGLNYKWALLADLNWQDLNKMGLRQNLTQLSTL